MSFKRLKKPYRGRKKGDVFKAQQFENNLQTAQRKLRERYLRKLVEKEKYNGWSNWDTWNTMLILENEHDTYRWLLAWCQNFKRKIKRGTFDAAKAESVVRKYLVPVARGKKRAGRQISYGGDDRIDPKKVNAAEIVFHIIAMED